MHCLPIVTVLWDYSCYLHEIYEETEMWLVSLGIKSQIQIATSRAVLYPASQIPKSHKLDSFMLKSSSVHLPSTFFVSSSLGLKKEKCFLIFTKNCVSWEIESLSYCICLSRVLTECHSQLLRDLGFFLVTAGDCCSVAYLPNTFKICLCAKPSNIVAFCGNYTFDFVLGSLQMPF